MWESTKVRTKKSKASRVQPRKAAMMAFLSVVWTRGIQAQASYHNSASFRAGGGRQKSEMQLAGGNAAQGGRRRLRGGWEAKMAGAMAGGHYGCVGSYRSGILTVDHERGY